jgi:hypothetical protein
MRDWKVVALTLLLLFGIGVALILAVILFTYIMSI